MKDKNDKFNPAPDHPEARTYLASATRAANSGSYSAVEVNSNSEQWETTDHKYYKVKGVRVRRVVYKIK